ncbi:hypothetical protein Tco_0132789, partial [Tanacetum coccineum]
MATLADKAILSGADNYPPMLEKDMYDSWKSIMELYMMNRQHGRMILESVENGPLIWPTIEENGVTRPKKYSELSATEANQADCDVKATNIILQGLSPEVYALVSNHRIAKELWEIIQLLMQGTSLTKQERECKLYDEFDKFDYKKGETLHDFYLRFSLLLNDMNIYNVKLEQFQAVEQQRLESKTFEVKMNQVLNENELLLEQVINNNIVNTIMNYSMDNASVNVHECEKCLKIETELLNKKDFVEKEIYDKLFRSFTTLEKHCISLEVDTQLNQEIFQRVNSVSNQSALSFDHYFELNELKAQS